MSKTGEITLMCGLPGSGKTTILQRIDTLHSVILCPDEFRLGLTGRAYFEQAEQFVWGAVQLTAKVLVQHQKQSILIDAVHRTAAQRGYWIRLAGTLEIPIYCYYRKVDPNICRQRNANRDNPVPDHVIDRMINSFEPPIHAEGFNEIYVLQQEDESDPTSEAKVTVLKIE